MIRLSSNQTLFLKLVFPIFFAVLYGLLTVFFLLSDFSPFPRTGWMKYSNLIFYFAVLLIFYKTIFQLLRVDCAADHFVVTNYRTAYRYSYDSIATFKEENLLLFTLGVIRFNSPSAFGNRIIFIVDKKMLKKIQTQFDVLNESLSID